MTLVETTTNVTTNTPYIKILQGHDRCNATLGPTGSGGPPGRDSTNGRDGVKGKKGEQGPKMRCGFYKMGKIFMSKYNRNMINHVSKG